MEPLAKRRGDALVLDQKLRERRVLLHPHCHQQVHHQGLDVVKPRPQTGV